MFNICVIYFDEELLLPGQSTSARMYPLAPEFWSEVRPGDTLGLYEGWRLVGSARIDRPIESEAERELGLVGRTAPSEALTPDLKTEGQLQDAS
jgi:hypothetical protein